MAVQLGPFQLEHPFILAPMAGITNSPFRRLMRRRRSALVVSELVSANGIEHAGHKTLDLLRFHEEERTVGLQIFGEDTELLCRAAQHVERVGADFVDLNLGCPVPKVVKKGAGSAMCRDPRALGQTLRSMVAAVKIPVTIKIRSGWDQGTRNALEVVQAAADAGVAWVAIHGRTRAQGYSGEADWDFIGEIKAKSPIPIIGNGDLSTAELAVQRLRTFGVDAVMIGRGALRNPFIFEQAYALWSGARALEAPQVSDYLDLIEQQKLLLAETYTNPRVSMIHARKFLGWYSAGFPGCHEFRRQVFSIPDPETLWAESRRFFETSAAARDHRFLSQPFFNGGAWVSGLPPGIAFLAARGYIVGRSNTTMKYLCFVIPFLAFSLPASAAKFYPIRNLVSPSLEALETAGAEASKLALKLTSSESHSFTSIYGFDRTAGEKDLNTVKQFAISNMGLFQEELDSIQPLAKPTSVVIASLFDALETEEKFEELYSQASPSLIQSLQKARRNKSVKFFEGRHSDEDGSWNVIFALDTKNQQVLVICVGYSGGT